MQVQGISNQNFGTLKYNPSARKLLNQLIIDENTFERCKVVQTLSDAFHISRTKNLKKFENQIKIARIKLENKADNILNKFKEALEIASKSDKLKIRIGCQKKTEKSPEGIIVTINDQSFAHRQGSSILNFLNKISTEISAK